MLINRVSDINDRGEINEDRVHDHTEEYQTVSELFEIMSKDHQPNANDALTASNLVLLYKKIDVGTIPISESKNMIKRPNQHVETVVYEDDPDSEDSDICEIYNTDDVNVYDYNKKRLDIFNHEGSLGNFLCQKFGGIQIQSSELNNEYQQHFNILHDPYIKDQLNYNFGFEDFEGSVLPATLLDYICCKRLEENYNFYMDNIIRYVKHTIDQLKRISNGDYLTEKAKQKWREISDPVGQINSTKILATSTSIPLHIERKTSKLVSSLDAIVHSEIDIRSLSKILEKKIIVEVPKLICGTYKLFSRRCAENLIITCKKETNPSIKEEKEDSRVDVVLQLDKSESGHVVSNISSIIILKTQQEIFASDPLPLSYTDVENKLNITEIEYDNEDNLDFVSKTSELHDMYEVKDKHFNDEGKHLKIHNDNSVYLCRENEKNNLEKDNYLECTEFNDDFKDDANLEHQLQSQWTYEATSSEDLQLTMQKFDMPLTLPEESIEDISQNTLSKKKSPTRIRIKSPYENQSHILEERKRRRLLEIREKRERKKMTLGENCKISKHKYARAGIMPQASSSVTKLSITNKSFYNSIYGQTAAFDQPKLKNRKGGKNGPIPEVPLDHEEEHDAPVITSDTKKYINRSYYLDDTETEIMYTQTRQNESSEMKASSASTSVESSDFRANLTLLSQLIGPSVTDVNAKLNQTTSDETVSSHKISVIDVKHNAEPKALARAGSTVNMAPTNTPINESAGNINDTKKPSSSVECRKSIDKIYDLMKKLENGDGNEYDVQKTKFTSLQTDRMNIIGHRVSSTIQGSDSGTSLKHHLTSSNPSCFSFEKTNTEDPKLKAVNNKSEMPIVPKVIISNKVQIIKTDGVKNKKTKMPLVSPTPKNKDNPLKVISELLHEFDNVQKFRQKIGETKVNKRQEIISSDTKTNSYQGSSKRRSRLELHLKETESLAKSPKVTSPRKLKTTLGIIRNTRQQTLAEENHDKVTKRRINDIIDEVKEARGEAVKGPTKFISRLNSLAQPKKSYVQARIDEQTRPKTLGRQKLATAPQLSERNLESANSRNKAKRTSTEAISSMSMKQPPVQPSDKVMSKRRSTNSSPENTNKPPSPVSSSKRNNVPPTPETLRKMVAVESYVKNHYRRAPTASPMHDRSLAPVHKSRIPLMPKDVEMASEESTDAGRKLHYMIRNMFHVVSDVAVPSEDLEKTCKKPDKFSVTEDLYKGDERASVDSDYTVDVFKDKNIVTAVEHITEKAIPHEMREDYMKVCNSVTEIEQLEIALCRRWPIGAFQKRLRIKNLTLTPKHSMKQVFVLESGDGSSFIKSSSSKSVNLDRSHDTQDLKTLPVLSKTEFDWNFTDFSMQIATVAYAFPQYQSPFELNTNIKSIADLYKVVEPLKDASEFYKGVKVIIEQPTPLMEVILENKRNADESSMPKLRVIAEDDKLDSVQGFANTIKSYEKNDTASLQTFDRDCEAKGDLTNIDYTTSLDMLMGILNEIEKITSCQTHITNNDADNQQYRELETILCDAAALEVMSNNCRELVSIASLDKLRKLESNSSMYTIYLSSDDENDNNSNNIFNITADAHQPLCLDKLVNVDIGTPECINRFTDVPSIIPLKVDHSTNVTNSFIGVLSRPSSLSVFSFREYQSLYSNSSIHAHKKVIHLSDHVMDGKKGKFRDLCTSVCKDKKKLNQKNDVDSFKLSLSCKEVARKVDQNRKPMLWKNKVKKESRIPDFDPMLKIKRDILVTVYSILVITVFAALSFPEMLYHI